jgi:transcriptional regulator with XRE-family HTH domain
METACSSLCDTLQIARKSKRISQLELALRMGVSQRHVSFVESGRAQPSRELLLSWLHELQAPLALRNVALQQGGFAPVYRGSELSDAVLAPVRDALGRLLAAHDPMPAMVIDAAWNVLQMNRGAQWLALTLMPWIAQLPQDQSINMHGRHASPRGHDAANDQPGRSCARHARASKG